MPRIALKIDVDTWRGTREGVPRLVSLLQRHHVNATFLFSLGPDHTGRAIRRVFRRGFAGKVLRTSVLSHYGLRTMLYGTLLPGPHIARRCAPQMRAVANEGFETGVHTYDHVEWQDRTAAASLAWTRAQLGLAVTAYEEVFARRPQVHGAAGWQVNAHLPGLEREFGFRIASDTRGSQPFVPIAGDGIPQYPTTLPTLDELIGRADLQPHDPVDYLLQATSSGSTDHVYTLHAELEGNAYLQAFEQLISGWRAQGYALGSLSELAAQSSVPLGRASIERGQVAGRSGWLAVQGATLT